MLTFKPKAPTGRRHTPKQKQAWKENWSLFVLLSALSQLRGLQYRTGIDVKDICELILVKIDELKQSQRTRMSLDNILDKKG